MRQAGEVEEVGWCRSASGADGGGDPRPTVEAEVEAVLTTVNIVAAACLQAGGWWRQHASGADQLCVKQN
jgi:hypothetical protein